MTSIRVPDTISKLNPGDSYPVVQGVDVGGFMDLKNEVNDNTSKIEANILNIKSLQKSGKTAVFNNVGDSTPQFPSEPHGNYLLVQRGQTQTVNIEMPTPTGGVLDGALFTVYNESLTQAARLMTTDSSTLNSASAINVPPENFTSFMYQLKDTNWLQLESGYIPAARINIANYVESKLSTDGKIHTEADLEASGFLKGVQVSGDEVSNVSGAKWLHFVGAKITQGKPGQAVVTIDNSGSGGGGSTSLTIDDGTTNVAGINSLEMRGIKVTRLPTDPGGSTGNVQITSGLNIHMDAPNQQYGSALANEIIVMPPLKVFDDPDTQGGETVKLELQHDLYEPMRAPSFLAYLKEETLVTGKYTPGSGDAQAVSRHRGALWFDDIVVPNGAYIELDRDNKSYAIQEADQQDPNVSGGTDYLIAFRAHLKGTAPSDGYVRLYLHYNNPGEFDPEGYVMDVQGQPMVVERSYHAGEELGVVDIVSIVNAKGLSKFQAVVEDTFQGDVINLTDRTEGATGLLIQALKDDEKTGLGLLQYESDTQQNIEFSSHYLGEKRLSMDYYAAYDSPTEVIKANTTKTVSDGVELSAKADMKATVASGEIILESDGNTMADFVFGKIFSAEETRMLRGKEIEIDMTVTSQSAASTVYGVVWTGTPDSYTADIIESWNNGSPIFENKWAAFESFEITEDPINVDRKFTQTTTVPSNAVNYGIIVTPSDGPVNPYAIKIRHFDVNVKNPFVGYSLDVPEMANETRYGFDSEYKDFVQNTQGMGGLRYTINNVAAGDPMPIGKVGSGNADITLDGTLNVIAGSVASGGEGALVFHEDGQARITTTLRLWNEQATDTEVTFWWSNIDPDTGALVEYQDSRFTVKVPAHAKNLLARMTFTHDVEKGQKFALRASADKDDGAFLQCFSDQHPLMRTTVYFKELTAIGGGADDPWGTLDLSQFEHVYSHELDGRIVIRNGNSATVNFVIEPHMFFDVKRAIKIENGIARPVRSLDYSYNYATHELKISLGETVQEARVLVGVYV